MWLIYLFILLLYFTLLYFTFYYYSNEMELHHQLTLQNYLCSFYFLFIICLFKINLISVV